MAAQLGAEVTVVERDGLGGACVLTDCVPSKTLIATSTTMAALEGSRSLGIRVTTGGNEAALLDAPRLYARVQSLARAQSADVAARLSAEGVKVLSGAATLAGPHRVVAGDTEIEADAVLIATGAEPRVLPGSEPDGERILTWRQLYDLDALPAELIVVGSGVTGAEFACAYQALGSQVTLVSSRDRMLPHEDADAAMVVEEVFRRRGMTVLGRSRAERVTRTGDGVTVSVSDGRDVRRYGSLCAMVRHRCRTPPGSGSPRPALMWIVPLASFRSTRCPRTTAPGVYAAGDCTGVLMLASVAAMQGRIAMWHALGEAVSPLRLRNVAAAIFTDPEIATVGVAEEGGRVRRDHRRRCGQIAAGDQCQGQDAGLPGRLRQAHRPVGAPGPCSAASWWRRGPSELILGSVAGGRAAAQRR